MPDHHIPMMPLQYYHIFNRAVGKEKAFLNDENYRYFLRLAKKHIAPVASVYAYALLPNHYHLLVRIKDEKVISDYYESNKQKPFDVLQKSYAEVVVQCFSNHLNAYTKAFNKMYDRKGNLFIPNFKRSEAAHDSDITSFIFYIHKNPVHHALADEIGKWKYDSYQSILSEKPTLLAREEIISWFGNKEAFIKFHRQPVYLKKDCLEE